MDVGQGGIAAVHPAAGGVPGERRTGAAAQQQLAGNLGRDLLVLRVAQAHGQLQIVGGVPVELAKGGLAFDPHAILAQKVVVALIVEASQGVAVDIGAFACFEAESAGRDRRLECRAAAAVIPVGDQGEHVIEDVVIVLGFEIEIVQSKVEIERSAEARLKAELLRPLAISRTTYVDRDHSVGAAELGIAIYAARGGQFRRVHGPAEHVEEELRGVVEDRVADEPVIVLRRIIAVAGIGGLRHQLQPFGGHELEVELVDVVRRAEHRVVAGRYLTQVPRLRHPGKRVGVLEDVDARPAPPVGAGGVGLEAEQDVGGHFQIDEAAPIGHAIGRIVIERARQAALAQLAAQARIGDRDVADLCRAGIGGAQLLARARPVVVLVEMLPDQVRAKPVAGNPLHRSAGRPEVAPVDVPLGEAVVVEALAAGPGAGDADAQRVAERNVDHAVQAHRAVIADLGLHFGAEMGVRQGGDHVDHAGRRVAAIERALRAAQHLDAGQVEEFRFEQSVAHQRRVVEAHCDRRIARRRNRLGPDPADREIVHAEIAFREGDVRNRSQQFRAAFDLPVVERLGGECGHRDRHVPDRFLALLRGDDDLRRAIVLRRARRFAGARDLDGPDGRGRGAGGGRHRAGGGQHYIGLGTGLARDQPRALEQRAERLVDRHFAMHGGGALPAGIFAGGDDLDIGLMAQRDDAGFRGLRRYVEATPLRRSRRRRHYEDTSSRPQQGGTPPHNPHVIPLPCGLFAPVIPQESPAAIFLIFAGGRGGFRSDRSGRSARPDFPARPWRSLRDRRCAACRRSFRGRCRDRR